MPYSKEERHYSGLVASLTRSRSADDPDLIAARQAHRTAAMAAWIEKQLDKAPPLTDSQLTRLSVLLRPVQR